MRVLILSGVQNMVEKEFIHKHIKKEERREMQYEMLKQRFDNCYYNYSVLGWCEALQTKGYQTENIIVNVECLQRRWAKENLLNPEQCSLEDIVIFQIEKFQPEILWFYMPEKNFLRHIKEKCHSIRLIMGWSGSAILPFPQWRDMDVILSCSPEAVATFRKNGCNAEHIHHAFYPPIRKHILKNQDKEDSVVFIGQILRQKDYHLYRTELLRQLKEMAPLKIYSPHYDSKYEDIVKYVLKIGIYAVWNVIKVKSLRNVMKETFPIFQRIDSWGDRPKRPVAFDFGRCLFSAVFGIEMFKVLQNAELVLNVHADSSPLYASNMRLFETTGMGSCLLTDKKKNLNELFETDKEIVVYESVEDCIEKVQWLREHREKVQEIGEAGMRRCLKCHTYERRAERLDYIIKKYISSPSKKFSKYRKIQPSISHLK